MAGSLILEVHDLVVNVLTGIYSQETHLPQPLKISISATLDIADRYTPDTPLDASKNYMTLKEAARRAGYSPRTLEWHARKLTDPHQSPHIVQAIQELRTELAVKHGTTFERHMKDMQRIRDQALAAGAYSAAVAAEYRRGQALGTIYVERKEIRVGTIDSMSKEEVMKKLEEISKLYGPGATKSIVSDQGDVLDVEPLAPKQPTVLEKLSNVEKIRKGLLEKGSAPIERPLFNSDED